MDKWDNRFLELAELVSTWSRDPSTKVGGVIVDEKNRVVGIGFNGFPRGVADDERLDDRDVKYQLIIHAELNAILNAQFTEGCTLYTWPVAPCSNCAATIIQAGIAKIVAPNTTHPRFQGSINTGLALLHEAGVEVTLVIPSFKLKLDAIQHKLEEWMPDHEVRWFEVPSWIGPIYRIRKVGAPPAFSPTFIRIAAKNFDLDSVDEVAQHIRQSLESYGPAQTIDITYDGRTIHYTVDEGEEL